MKVPIVDRAEVRRVEAVGRQHEPAAFPDKAERPACHKCVRIVAEEERQGKERLPAVEEKDETRQRIAAAVHRRLLLLPFNLDTTQPRQRVAGGEKTRLSYLGDKMRSLKVKRGDKA
jgi:hypothetical protein